MPFHIIRNDIAAMTVDAIVNTANPMPVVGDGVDAAIHEKAGPQLLAERKRIGKLAPGQCAVTAGFDLNCRFVIHTVGPVWKGGLLGEGRVLRKCYESALMLAQRHGCESVAMPLISTGNYGFPRERALRIALNAIGAFLLKNDMTVYLVVYDSESTALSRELFGDVAAYIDDHQTVKKSAYRAKRRGMGCAPVEKYTMPEEDLWEAAPQMAPCAAASSLEAFLEQTDAGFSQTLLRLIDERGLKDPQVYKRANLTRQHFAKIRKDPDYRPSKATAIACAIALELDLEGTRDLIGRAGYSLTRASKFDLIVMYYIERREYDVMTINTALFAFDQSLLGN